MAVRPGFVGSLVPLLALAFVMAFGDRAAAQGAESLPVVLPDGPAKEGFDIDRFNNAGNGWFETFSVEETESLKDVLEAGRVVEDTQVLVLDTAAGKLALLKDQMGYHHLAEGTAGGKDWLATF